MICAWKELLNILPPRLRPVVDREGREAAQELRLRINVPPELVLPGQSRWLTGEVTAEELEFVVNATSRYSPWAAQTAAQGYLTAPGGHRVGLCGQAAVQKGVIQGIREVSSVCIRVARDVPGIARKAMGTRGSILILGAPGWGKTTLLRDLVRQISDWDAVAVVDERGELFPPGFPRGRRVDVMTGCPKAAGVFMALRTMGPSWIAVDEITQDEDCQCLIQAANCGVGLLATAHGRTVEDLHHRPVYRKLVESRAFETVLMLRKDQSYTMERMAL